MVRTLNTGRPVTSGFHQQILTTGGASSSGSETTRLSFDGAYAKIGAQSVHATSTGNTTIDIKGAVATSSDATGAVLITLDSTATGDIVLESSADRTFSQVWGEITANPSSVAIEVFISVAP